MIGLPVATTTKAPDPKLSPDRGAQAGAGLLEHRQRPANVWSMVVTPARRRTVMQ